MEEPTKEQKNENEEPEKVDQAAAKEEETPKAPLKGLVGTKIGMTRIFVDEKNMVPVSVVSVENGVVSQVKTREKDGYNAVQIAYGDTAERKLTKPELHHLKKKGLSPKRFLREFVVEESGAFKVGQVVPVSSFAQGEWVQVSGVTKGKGFAGAMKRFGFHGGPHSHGHGEYRRAPGSSGGQQPQRVIPGTRKPGHKGAAFHTELKVQVVDIDEENNLILLRGSIPGPSGQVVTIRPTKKRVSGEAASAPSKGKK